MKKHIRAIISLFTICVMLFTLSVPAFAASYSGNLHPGSMTSDDESMGKYVINTYFSTTSGSPPSEYDGLKLIAEYRLYQPQSDFYSVQWFYYDPTQNIPAVTFDSSGTGFYSITFPQSYCGIVNQKTGEYIRAGFQGSQNITFMFDKPVNPTAGMIGRGHYGTYMADSHDGMHYNLLALKWYTTPDLTQLGADGNLSESDFNMSGLEVRITPRLKTGLTEDDRSHMDDGTEWDKDYFDVMVINNTDTWYQIRFGVKNFFGNSHEYSWTCNSQEWNYAPKVLESMKYESDGQLVDGTFETVEKQFGNSEWHIVGGHSAYEQMIQWDDLDLKANALYYFYVEATPAVSKYASNLVNDSPLSKKENSQYAFSHNKNGNVVVYDNDAQQALIGAKPSIIYTATFSLADAIPYNPNNENIYSGTLSNYTPDPGAGKISAIEDKNGNVIGANGGGLNYDYNFDVDKVSLSDMKGLIDSTSGFVGLFQGLMGIFPAFVWIIIAAGLTALVILRILGR
mgnify:CR=1 FL=1